MNARNNVRDRRRVAVRGIADSSARRGMETQVTRGYVLAVSARSKTIDVLFLNWRDRSHPEGGGSEEYVQRVAAGRAAQGLRGGLVCAGHARAPADEVVEGVEVLRRGGRLGVYLRGMAHVARS